MIGILGCTWVIAVVGLAVSAASAGFGVYQYYDAKDRSEKAEEKNDQKMAEQERKAYVMAQRQMAEAVQSYNRGTLSTKKELLEHERRQNAPKYTTGKPVN